MSIHSPLHLVNQTNKSLKNYWLFLSEDNPNLIIMMLLLGVYSIYALISRSIQPHEIAPREEIFWLEHRN